MRARGIDRGDGGFGGDGAGGGDSDSERATSGASGGVGGGRSHPGHSQFSSLMQAPRVPVPVVPVPVPVPVLSGLHMANMRLCLRKQPSCRSRQQCDSQQVWYRTEQYDSGEGGGGLAPRSALGVMAVDSTPRNVLLLTALPLLIVPSMLVALPTLRVGRGGGEGGLGVGLESTSQSHVPSVGHTSKQDA